MKIYHIRARRPKRHRTLCGGYADHRDISFDWKPHTIGDYACCIACVAEQQRQQAERKNKHPKVSTVSQETL